MLIKVNMIVHSLFRNLLPLTNPLLTIDLPVLSFDMPEAIISMPFLLSLLLLLFLCGLS